MVAPPGAYLSGCYDGHLAEPLPNELHAFEAKAALMNGSVLAVCKQAVAAISGIRKPAHITPPPENASQDQLEAWSQTLLTSSANMRVVMNFALAVPYSFQSGVSLSVTELHNLPEGGLFGNSDVIYKVRTVVCATVNGHCLFESHGLVNSYRINIIYLSIYIFIYLYIFFLSSDSFM
jgi:hypothetical protein